MAGNGSGGADIFGRYEKFDPRSQIEYTMSLVDKLLDDGEIPSGIPWTDATFQRALIEK